MKRRDFIGASLLSFGGVASSLYLPKMISSDHERLAPRPTTYYMSSSQGNDHWDGLTPASAWQTLARINTAPIAPGDRILFRRGDLWRGTLKVTSGTTEQPTCYGAFGSGQKPIIQGSVAKDLPESWVTAGKNLWTSILNEDVDVGNLIFDHGRACGFKKWRLEDLNHNGDFWYDPRPPRVLLFSDSPPAVTHRSIELALNRNIVTQDGCRYISYEDLHLRYSSACGINGSNTDHITVRRCDISFIGGGHQLTKPDGTPVRFGNGINFWNSARNNAIEQCRLWEIYDAALSNQGIGIRSESEQLNIIYRDNIIWNAEYSYEYWNEPATSSTKNVVFEHNTCVSAGRGWGHGQRPNKNGHHLMFWRNTAATQGVTVSNNIFFDATEGCLRMDNDWRHGLTLERNVWFQNGGPMFLFLRQNYTAGKYEAYRAASGFDRHSLIADPRFRDSRHHDYRLRIDSPALSWTKDNDPCGARYDEDLRSPETT